MSRIVAVQSKLEVPLIRWAISFFIFHTLLFGKTDISRAQDACVGGEMTNAVRGNDYCLVVKTFKGKTAPVTGGTVIIIIHGDQSSGGPTTVQYALARQISLENPSSIAIGLIRPGYFDADGRRSDGHDGGRGDNITPVNVDAIAKATAALRDFHHAARVILVGHSGGAAISGVILGRHPGLAEGAFLVSCPCDVTLSRDPTRRPWTKSLAPASYVSNVPTSAFVFGIHGAKDGRTFSWHVLKYIDDLKSRGISARFIEIPNAGHNIDSNLRKAVVEELKPFVLSAR